jgi:hypothetical protein
MPKLIADENFKDSILDPLLARRPRLECVRAKDVGLISTPDDVLLEWAAREGRLVLTHDKKTLIPAANRRLRESAPMPGVIFVPWILAEGTAIDDLELLLFGSPDDALAGRVHYLPLRT